MLVFSRFASSRSLRSRFTQLVTISTLLAVLVSAALGFMVARKVLIFQIEQRLELALSERKKLILQYIDNQEAQLRLNSKRTLLQEVLTQYIKSSPPSSYLQGLGERILQESVSISGGIREIWVADLNGHTRLSSAPKYYQHNVAVLPSFKEGIRDFSLEPPRLVDGRYQSVASVPMTASDGTPLAVLFAIIDAEPLRKVLQAPIGEEVTGEVLLAKREGDLISFIFPSRFVRTSNSIAVSSEAPLARAAHGQTGSMLTTNSRGVPLIAAFGPLGYSSWVLLARIETAEAYKPITTLAIQLLVVVLGSCLVLGTISWYVAGSVAEPVRSLQRAVTELATGNLTSRVELSRKDELGALATAFNNMAQALEHEIDQRRAAETELRNLNDCLEERILERTNLLQNSQAKLRQAERMASIGAFASGIAHEINNPVGAMVLTAENALSRQEDLVDPPAMAALLKRTCAKILAHAERCQTIVKGILQFARDESTEKLPQDLNQVIRSAIRVLGETAPPAHARIALHLAPVLKLIHVNAFEMEQVVLNLVQNAVDAKASRITITTANTNEGVRLSVQDNGCGIPNDILRHIFDPFFTTRLRNGGTGLGLSIVHGIVSSHEGTIAMESEKGRGTRAVIDFYERECQSRLVA